MIIFLIGYMGCGKSTIGRSLAGRLGAGFVDMDKWIEERQGMSINEIFATLGEPAFREMERDFIMQPFDRERDMVVATGGGAPCQGDNMALMNTVGQTVYMKMSPAKLLQRLGKGRERRPLIRGMNDEELLEFIERNIKVRAPFYEKARMVVDCDGVSDEYIARHIEFYVEQTKQKL